MLSVMCYSNAIEATRALGLKEIKHVMQSAPIRRHCGVAVYSRDTIGFDIDPIKILARRGRSATSAAKSKQ